MTNKNHDDESEKENGATSGETQQWQATCSVCESPTVYTDKEAFREHVNTHPKCGKCGRRFSSDTALGSHALTCQGTGE